MGHITWRMQRPCGEDKVELIVLLGLLSCPCRCWLRVGTRRVENGTEASGGRLLL